MNLNMQSLRGDGSPKAVLYQFDQLDPMNPQGLLIAYAEDYVLPVVSDFDIFTVGMQAEGQHYEHLDDSQLKIAMNMLNNVETILQKPVPSIPWNSRWLEVLQKEKEAGYHPDVPQYGFGDPASVALVKGIVGHTGSCGAVRHGPECFNITFPQEFDKEYLIIWEGFDPIRWKYVDEPSLREFLSYRLCDGFTFPLNPAWPCVHPGWYELYESMREIEGEALDAWFPPESGLQDRIEAIHKSHPGGFSEVCFAPAGPRRESLRPSMFIRGSVDLSLLQPDPNSKTGCDIASESESDLDPSLPQADELRIDSPG